MRGTGPQHTVRNMLARAQNPHARAGNEADVPTLNLACRVLLARQVTDLGIETDPGADRRKRAAYKTRPQGAVVTNGKGRTTPSGP